MCQAQTKNEDIQISFGGGYPFLLVPQVAYQQNNISYYLNYKMGLDDGFSLGAQIHNNQHVYGAFIGAIGAKDASSVDDSFFRLFEDQTTQGIGVSYEIRFTPQKNASWALRAEIGYGKESHTNTKRADGNIQLVYHF